MREEGDDELLSNISEYENLNDLEKLDWVNDLKEIAEVWRITKTVIFSSDLKMNEANHAQNMLMEVAGQSKLKGLKAKIIERNTYSKISRDEK